jgi:hypothetical protein
MFKSIYILLDFLFILLSFIILYKYLEYFRHSTLLLDRSFLFFLIVFYVLGYVQFVISIFKDKSHSSNHKWLMLLYSFSCVPVLALIFFTLFFIL